MNRKRGRVRNGLAVAGRLVFGRRGRPWGRVNRVVLAVAVAYAGLFFCPGVLFAHRVVSGPFEVWSDEPIDPAIAAALDEAGGLLARSPLHDPAARHRIVLCNTAIRRSLLAPGRAGAFGVTYGIANLSALNRTDVKAGLVFRDAATSDRRSLASVVAHERTHSAIARRYGLFGSRLLPEWKVEGYCEVVAGGSSFDPEAGRRMIREGEDDGSGPFRYFRYRLMVDYLLRVEGLDVDAIMARDLDEARVMEGVRRSLDRIAP